MALIARCARRHTEVLAWTRLVQPLLRESLVWPNLSCPASTPSRTDAEPAQCSGHRELWAVPTSFACRSFSTARPHPRRARTDDHGKNSGIEQREVAVHIREFQRRAPLAARHEEATAKDARPALVQALKAAGWSRQEVVNVPNALSLGRMLSGPLIGWWIVQGRWDIVVPALALSAASDWLDGFAARRLKQQSVLGSYLDPIADKVLIGSVTVALVKAGCLPAALAFVILGRDVGLVAGGVLMRARELDWKWPGVAEFFRLGGGNAAAPVQPLLISKLNTVLQLGLAGGCALQGLTGWPPGEALLSLGMLTAGTTIWSATAYARAFLAAKGEQKVAKPPDRAPALPPQRKQRAGRGNR